MTTVTPHRVHLKAGSQTLTTDLFLAVTFSKLLDRIIQRPPPGITHRELAGDYYFRKSFRGPQDRPSSHPPLEFDVEISVPGWYTQFLLDHWEFRAEKMADPSLPVPERFSEKVVAQMEPHAALHSIPADYFEVRSDDEVATLF